MSTYLCYIKDLLSEEIKEDTIIVLENANFYNALNYIISMGCESALDYGPRNEKSKNVWMDEFYKYTIIKVSDGRTNNSIKRNYM